MEPQPDRKRPMTVTRNTIKWKVVDKGLARDGWFKDADLERLASVHTIDEELLRQLFRKLTSLLRPELHLSQPELGPASSKAGQKKLARANDLMRSAQGKLFEASKIMESLGFSNPLAYAGVRNPSGRHLSELVSTLESLKECRDFYETMERSELAYFLGTPDLRKASDERRTILCITIFNLWLDLERDLGYTTDPNSGERTGPLIEFVNDVVECMTEPPSRLSGEAIKRELDDFRS